MHIVGVDYSKDIKKRGLSIASIKENKLVFEYIGLYSESIINNVFRESGVKLMAIDAPLGWPISLSENLINHKAGNFIAEDSNRMFRRETDRIVKEVTDKQSLDVGADKIARTAHGALETIQEIRKKFEIDLPITWNYECIDESSVIEVYPAVTLKQGGIRFEGYKKKVNIDERREIADRLLNVCNFSNEQRELAINDDNILDSIVCVLAGFDFINGKCLEPLNIDLAQKEGWIWFHSVQHIL